MFKILSIDGGGIKGAFPASLLAQVEAQIGGSIADYFDLIVGTSTGGIIALGLGLGVPASSIAAIYAKKGKNIFPASMSFRKRSWRFFRRKYSSDPLRLVLEKTFGEATLGESRRMLVIPSQNAQDGRIHIFKTPHLERFETDWQCKAVDVAMATSAAPTYFSPYLLREDITLLDGGLWANNPTGLAVVEAIGYLKKSPDEIRVLSLGCTCEPQNFMLENAGMFGWRTKAIEAAFAGQSFAALGTAYVLTSHEQVLRINPNVEPGRFKLDNPKRTKDLVELGKAEAREYMPRIRSMFLSEKAPPFTPFHGNRSAEGRSKAKRSD